VCGMYTNHKTKEAGRANLPLLLVAALAYSSALRAQQAPPQDVGAGSAPVAATPERVTFDVFEYRVLGNTTLPAAVVERAVTPFLGSDKTLADVEAARKNLEQAYRDAGFGTVFVDLPEQSTAEGIIRMQITEGRLDRVRITGSRYFSNGQIRAALPSLVSGSVPNIPQVQSELAAINGRTPDRSITPILKAGRVPGTVDVELKVTDELPVHGSLELNDRYSADTSHLRAQGSLSYGNLFQQQHNLSLQYQTAPQDTEDLRAIVGTYLFRPADWENTSFALYAVDSSTDVAALGTLSVIGDGQIFGLRVVRSLPQFKDYSHNIMAGVEYKSFDETINVTPDQALATPLNYLNWSVTYSGSQRRGKTASTYDVGIGFGIRGLVNDAQDFAEKRYKGSPNYFYLRGGTQQVYELSANWQLFGRVSAQVSPSPLVSNEQFGIGGADTVRGYLESSVLGDYGAVGTVEVRRGIHSKALHLAPGIVYLFAFYDAGAAGLREPLPEQDSEFDLASWGAGLRVNGLFGFSAALDWARALRENGAIESGDQRFLFSVKYSF